MTNTSKKIQLVVYIGEEADICVSVNKMNKIGMMYNLTLLTNFFFFGNWKYILNINCFLDMKITTH